MPQDAQQLPTWGQHGPNIGSKRSAKIGPRCLKISSRGGLRPESPSDLNMDPKWIPNGSQMDPKLGSKGHVFLRKQTPLLGTSTRTPRLVQVTCFQKTRDPARNADPNITASFRSCFSQKTKAPARNVDPNTTASSKS